MFAKTQYLVMRVPSKSKGQISMKKAQHASFFLPVSFTV